MSTQETISYIDKDLNEINATLTAILKILEKIEKDGIYVAKL